MPSACSSDVSVTGDSNLPAPDVALVDAGQLLYHVVWPVDRIAEDWLQATVLDCLLCPKQLCYSTGTINRLIARGITKGREEE